MAPPKTWQDHTRPVKLSGTGKACQKSWPLIFFLSRSKASVIWTGRDAEHLEWHCQPGSGLVALFATKHFVNPLTPALHESGRFSAPELDFSQTLPLLLRPCQEFGGGEMSNAELVARLERQFAGLGNPLRWSFIFLMSLMPLFLLSQMDNRTEAAGKVSRGSNSSSKRAAEEGPWGKETLRDNVSTRLGCCIRAAGTMKCLSY